MSGFVQQRGFVRSRPATGRGTDSRRRSGILEKNYQREFSMDELAEALHLSKKLSVYLL